MLRYLALILYFFSFQSQAQILNQFAVLKKEALSAKMINSDLIIHETHDYFLLKSPLTNFSSYDYFFVQLTSDPKLFQWIKENTNLVYEKDQKFAVLQINNEKELLAVSEKLHHAAHSCGMLQKLSEMPLHFSIKDPEPVFREKNQDIVAAVALASDNNIIENINTMVSWKSRYHQDPSGMKTGQRLQAMYKALIPNERTDIELELVNHQGSPQKSLIVRIPGTTQPDEILILGSHLDSINSKDNALAPGADDNASGTSTNLEVFRILMEKNIKPLKTIEIHAYAAEEIGLVGSGEIAESYRSQNKNVTAMVQFDMNGFSNGEPKVTFVTNSTNSTLTKQLQGLVDDYLNIGHATGFLLFGSSDHASWKKKGYPVAFPTEDPFGFNRKIHTKDDTLDFINTPEQMKEFAKLGVAYFMHFAGF